MNALLQSLLKNGALVAALLAGLWGAAVGRAADAVDEVRTLTEFKEIEMDKLAGGDIASLRGHLMEFSRGIAAQTCYFVAASPKATAEAIRSWDPSPHSSIGVFAHRAVRFPAQESDLDLSALKTDKSPVRWLVGRTLATRSDHSDLHLSRAEAQEIERGCQGQPQNAETATACWRKILAARAAVLQQKGIANLPPYEMGNGTVRMAEEIQSLLKGNPLAATRFARILSEAKLTGKSTESGPGSASQYYWELITVEDHAALGLGATCVRAVENRFQVVDCEYYVSNGFHVSLILYEIWPARDGSLVWRTDLLSSPELGRMKGIERMAYGKIMVLEIKKVIGLFQKDVRKGSKTGE